MPDPTVPNQRYQRVLRRAVYVAVSMYALMFAAGNAGAQETYKLEDQQWQKQTAYDPETPEGKIKQTRKTLANGKAKRAEKLVDQWIEQYPTHELIAEAYLIRGDARVVRGRYYKALFDYEYLARSYPASEHFHTALEREYEIARLFAGGTKRRFLGMRVLPARSEAEELYIRIQQRAPGSEIGEKASLALADYYLAKSEMATAAVAYDMFLDNYPQSQRREQAMVRLIQANLATFKGPKFDPTGLIEAAHRLKTYRQQYPATADRIGADTLLVRIEESLALKDYYSGFWYGRQGRIRSMIYTYQRVIQDYPRTAAAEMAIQKLGELGEPVAMPPEVDEAETSVELKTSS